MLQTLSSRLSWLQGGHVPAGCCWILPLSHNVHVGVVQHVVIYLQGGHSTCSTATAAEGQARRGPGSAEGDSAVPQRLKLPQCMAPRVAARSGHLLCGGQVPLGAERGVPALVPEPLPCRPLWGVVWKVLPRCSACAWLHNQLACKSSGLKGATCCIGSAEGGT